jgi:hypothetical protein
MHPLNLIIIIMRFKREMANASKQIPHHFVSSPKLKKDTGIVRVVVVAPNNLDIIC